MFPEPSRFQPLWSVKDSADQNRKSEKSQDKPVKLVSAGRSDMDVTLKPPSKHSPITTLAVSMFMLHMRRRQRRLESFQTWSTCVPSCFLEPPHALPVRACDKFVPFHNLCDRKCDICEHEL